MNRLSFLLARWRGDDAALMRLSTPLQTVMEELAGKHVALVGNARALARGDAGAQIDAADIVIRLNAAPMPTPASHGTRTDWLAMSIPVDAATIATRAPRRLLWMPTTRKRLPWRIACDPRFALNPQGRNAELRAILGAPPTTGLQMIDLVARSSMAELRLHGFDFFASQSLSGRRSAADVPHDFSAEHDFVTDLAARDPRVILPASTATAATS